MQNPPDTAKVIARTVELLGGPDQAREITDKEFGEMGRRWDQNTDAIGRILRSHLYVEHYLTEFIRHANPRLGSIGDARLGFSPKWVLPPTEN